MKGTSFKFVAAVAFLFVLADSVSADVAAIAYSPSTGRWGSSYGYSSRASAESAALTRCNAADARAVVWVQNGWAALAIGENGARGWGWSTNSLNEAKNQAIKNAGRNASIRCWVFSGW